ncbi:MAG: AMP-binding protein [bacterium]
MSLYGTFVRNALLHPEKTAVVAGRKRISYRELLNAVERVACGLGTLGLREGDRLALLMPNCPEFIVAFYAAMKLGIITFSINTMFKEDETNHLLGDAEPKAIIVHGNYLPLVAGSERARQGMMHVIVAAAGESEAKSALTFESLQERGCPEASPAEIEPGAGAVIAYTSGTTGFPKGALHPQENLRFHLEGISAHLGLGSDDVIIAALPFFQLVAFLIQAGMAMHTGGTVVLLEKFEPRGFLEAVGKEKATFFSAVPTIYHMIHAASRELEVDLSTVRFGICAGSPLALDLRREFERKFGFRIIHCYGMTEIALIAACEDPLAPPKGVSVGRVLPYIRLRIAGEDGSPVEAGQVGEIQIGAERALARYWNDTGESLRGGWFATGDLGRFDEEGHLFIVDRKKDMIIRGGFNVYPAEIERVLAQDPRIREVAVVGIPHKRLGEVPKAFVVLRDGATATAEELLGLCRQKLANFKTLEAVEFVEPDFFPRNALGKIVKTRLRIPRGKP